MDESQKNDYLKSAVEALLFISDKPVEIEQIKEVMETVGVNEIRCAVQELMKDYERFDRGMIIAEIAGGFQMLTNPQCAEHVRNFFKSRVKEKLSRPALEALAIAAYRQPVSRADVELIRGVNSDGVVTHLLEKGLIKIVGRKDVAGRPFLYGTTKVFLEYFGLKSLKDLPKLEDVGELLQGADGLKGEGEGGVGLFASNKVRSMEEAVSDFGGENHIEQSFAREAGYAEEAFPEEGECDHEPAAADAGEVPAEGPEDSGLEEGEDALQEGPKDLKKVMEEMSRDHSVSEEKDGQQDGLKEAQSAGLENS